MGHLHYMNEYDFSALKPWSRNWEPRSKIVAAVLFVFAVISLNNPWTVLAALLFVLAAALFMGVALSFLLKRLALLVPFLALMCLPIVFGGGLPPAAERSIFAALISLKALTSMTAMIILTATQPVDELLEGLAQLRVPPAVITVLFLAYRYGCLLMGELKTTQKALGSRLFKPGLSAGALRVYGELSGGLFLKALARSDDVYRAMLSRCFDGKMPAARANDLSGADIAKCLSAVSVALLLVVVERVM